MSYSTGLVYAVLSGLFLSTGGLFARFLAEADAWTVLFYRSLAFSSTVVLFMLWRYRSHFWLKLQSLRPGDLLVTLFLALGFVFYLLSLYHTSVANTVLLLSTGPFFAAFLGKLILREAVLRATWTGMAMAMLGVFIMVSGGVSADDALGMLFAVIAVLSYAAMLVVMRSAKTKGEESRELLPATALAGLLAALLCLPMIESFALQPTEFLISLCFGSIQVGAGFILITLAAQVVPAAQVALLSLAETALAPLWVWLVFTETPDTRTLVGGTLIVAAVLYNGIVTLRGTEN